MAVEDLTAPAFAAFQRIPQETRIVRRRRSATLGVSLGIHGLVLVAATAGAFSRQVPVSRPEAPRVQVSLGRLSAPRMATPPRPETQTPPPNRPTPRRSAALVQPDRQRQVAQPVDTEVATPTDDAGVEENAGAPLADQEPEGVSGALTTAPAPAPPAPAAPPAMTAAQRRRHLERYLQEALRRKIDSRFAYPPQAEREGVEGTVVLRLTIDCSGRLLAVATIGGCPSDILCDHAQRTTRDASPYPPPPRELGSTIQVDIPIAYRLN